MELVAEFFVHRHNRGDVVCNQTVRDGQIQSRQPQTANFIGLRNMTIPVWSSSVVEEAVLVVLLVVILLVVN